MEPPSPIKSWIHKHSPLKSRNKPLPPPPSDSSPARKPVEPVSGNTSPSKPKTTNRFLSLLKSKATQPSSLLPPTNLSQRTPIHKKTFRSGRGRAPDLNTVSKKISDLEAQLKEAQRELTVIASQQQSTDVESTALDRQITQRQENLSQGGRFDGLVENLLGQVSPSQRPVTRRGHAEAATPNAFLDYQAIEEAYEPAAPEAESPHSRQLKRKRSEPSWQEMQERIAEFQKQQQPDTIKKVKRTLDPPSYSKPQRQGRETLLESPAADADLQEPKEGFSASEGEDEEEGELTALPQMRLHPQRGRVITVTATSSSPSRRQYTQHITETLTTPFMEEQQEPQEEDEDDEINDTLAPLTPSRVHGGRDNDDNDSIAEKTTVSAAQRALHRRTHVFVPGGSKRLSKVVEEFEWNDEEIF